MANGDAPLEIGHVVLTVRDLGGLSSYYQRAVGLDVLSAEGDTVRLGAGGRPLLELRRDPAARIRARREAGLFHTAFLLPSRADLGRWLRHTAETRETVEGAADHLVSEAIYLSDPEGNGIEVYADRPRETWTLTPEGGVAMASDPLDYEGLAAAGGAGVWRGAPEGTVVGHVHLQVGRLSEAEAFYAGKLGFDITCHYPGATFYGSGGYHHHIATNIWNSRGAGPVSQPATGLSEVALRAAPSELARIGGGLSDPWGTEITVTAQEA